MAAGSAVGPAMHASVLTLVHGLVTKNVFQASEWFAEPFTPLCAINVLVDSDEKSYVTLLLQKIQLPCLDVAHGSTTNNTNVQVKIIRRPKTRKSLPNKTTDIDLPP